MKCVFCAVRSLIVQAKLSVPAGAPVHWIAGDMFMGADEAAGNTRPPSTVLRLVVVSVIAPPSPAAGLSTGPAAPPSAVEPAAPGAPEAPVVPEAPVGP